MTEPPLARAVASARQRLGGDRVSVVVRPDPAGELLTGADVKPWAEKYPDVDVETVIVDRPAADVLIGISSTAQLIVVGTRGHGGFAGVLVGSVGLHLLHHGECPVLVDRAATTA